MAVDWRQFCKVRDLDVRGDAVDVTLDNDRRHRIAVREEPAGFRCTAVVARSAVVAGIPGAPLLAWLRNRETRLVGFRFDPRGNLVAEAVVPRAGLERDEFRLYLRSLAVEADWFEYTLTGRDAE